MVSTVLFCVETLKVRTRRFSPLDKLSCWYKYGQVSLSFWFMLNRIAHGKTSQQRGVFPDIAHRHVSFQTPSVVTAHPRRTRYALPVRHVP